MAFERATGVDHQKTLITLCKESEIKEFILEPRSLRLISSPVAGTFATHCYTVMLNVRIPSLKLAGWPVFINRLRTVTCCYTALLQQAS